MSNWLSELKSKFEELYPKVYKVLVDGINNIIITEKPYKRHLKE